MGLRRGRYRWGMSENFPFKHIEEGALQAYKWSLNRIKWDLEHGLPMEGKANRRLIQIIGLLEQEGVL